MTELLREYALAMVGLPYRWGGDDPILGYDCSGLVQELLAAVDMDPPGDQSAQQLYEYFKDRNLGSFLGCGALVFYGKSITEITHVAIMIDETTVIEAGGGGSSTTTLDAAAKQNAFIRLRRFDRRKDIVAILMPRFGYMKDVAPDYMPRYGKSK